MNFDFIYDYNEFTDKTDIWDMRDKTTRESKIQIKYKLEYDMNTQHIGPIVFNIPKILKMWIKVIRERGAENIKIVEV